MNILLCSVGRRVKLVKYFREELGKIGGKILAADCDSTAPALHFADIAVVVPRITDPDYLKTIKLVCQKYNVNAVLSLIDPELTLLAEHKEEFEKEHIKIIVSNKDVVNMCLDKYQTFQFLQKHSLPGIPTYLKINEILTALENNQLQFPLVIKPRYGSASLGISFINSTEELLAVWRETDEFIAQPFVNGNECGVDCYVDLINGQTTNIFCKRKIKMRAGETDKSVAINDPNLIQLIEKLVHILAPVGPIDIDCFITESGYLISEINPRFGGGYPHAHEEGQNFAKNIINNLEGRPNCIRVGDYTEGSILIKFDDVMVLNSNDKASYSIDLRESVSAVENN